MKQAIDDLKFLFDFFKRKNKQLYLVGGAVRDMILGKKPMDYDLATDALPDEITHWFDKVVDTGAHFGTIGVVLPGGKYEITTFRRDLCYTDGRHPSSVIYTDDVRLDVMRRDFTINAILMDGDGVVYDYVGGLADLQNGLIRAIGNPDDRFAEDKLRKWRCIRLAAEQAMIIEDETKASILNDPDITGVSMERIREEFRRLLVSEKVTWGGYLLLKCNLIKSLFLERDIHFKNRDWRHAFLESFEAMAFVPRHLETRLAMLLHNLVPEERELFLKTLKFPRRTQKQVLALCEHYQVNCNDIVSFKQTIADLGHNGFATLLSIQQGEAAWDGGSLKCEIVKKNKRIYANIVSRGDPIFVRDLKINGKDFVDAGYRGPAIKQGIAAALSLVYRYPEYNNRSDLLSFIESYHESTSEDENGEKETS